MSQIPWLRPPESLREVLGNEVYDYLEALHILVNGSGVGIKGTLDADNVAPVEQLRTESIDTEAVVQPKGDGTLTIGMGAGSEGANLGDGAAIYSGRVGASHQFRSIAGDATVDVLASDSEVRVAVNESGLQTAQAPILTFGDAAILSGAKRLTAGSGITLAEGDEGVTISASGGDLDAGSIGGKTADEFTQTVNGLTQQVVIEGDSATRVAVQNGKVKVRSRKSMRKRWYLA